MSGAGFIGEVIWSDRGMPSLDTRALVWEGIEGGAAMPHPDLGLLVSRVIAEQAPVIVDLGGTAAPTIGHFLGLPLMSSERMVGLVGLAAPAEPYRHEWITQLQPLLSACASIVESLQSSSDRHRLLGELEHTAGFLQAIINGSSHGILVIDQSSRVVTANPAAHQLLAAEPDTLIGHDVGEFASADQSRRLNTLLRRALRDGLPDKVSPFVSSITGFDGGMRPVEVAVGEMRVADQRCLVVMLLDVSQRLQAQAALARAAEIIDSTPDLIVWADPEGRVIFLNEGGRTMLGLGHDDDAHALSVESLAQDPDQMAAILAAAAETGVWRGELALSTMEGEPVPVSVVAIIDENYVALLARDLTERHEIERLKEAFVANVSHELRTPLTAVIGYLELLEEGILGDLSVEQSDAVGIMKRNGDRLLDLIGDILLIGSMDAGSTSARRPVDLARVVADVVRSTAATRERRGLNIEVDADPTPDLRGDDGELKTVVTNLVGNAMKFTPSGGTIRVSVRNTEEGVRLEVSDNGVGIAPEELEFVFRRFYRGNDARTSEVQGAGLGLAIVHGVVQRHAGSVDIESTVGTGTKITVVLPPEEKGSR
jgi:PAS domain S-box-containing protein